jgi:hypothetical protein
MSVPSPDGNVAADPAGFDREPALATLASCEQHVCGEKQLEIGSG